MKFKRFDDIKFDVRQSAKQTYHDAEGNDTGENIIYLRFDEEIAVGDCEKDFAVCSRAVASELATYKGKPKEAIAFLYTCDIVDNDGQLGIQMADNSTLLFSNR